MQEFLKNVRRFFAQLFGRLARLGPTALVLAIGVVALVMGGMFVFGHPAFGLTGDNPKNSGKNGTAQLLPNDAIASIANLDSDNDGLKDLDELRYRTDPHNPDTDGDGFKDGEEVAKGFNPNSLPGTKPWSDKLPEFGTSGTVGTGKTDTSFSDLLGMKSVDPKVDGLNVGGLGGLPEADVKKLENQILPSGQRLGDLEFDKLMSKSSQALPTVDASKVKVAKADDHAAREKYFKQAAGIILAFNPFPHGYKVQMLLNDIDHFNRDQLEKIKLSEESAYRELVILEVPKSMIDEQVHALSILGAIRETVDRLLTSSGSADDTLYATGRTVFLMGEIGSLIKSVALKLK